jgi:hypothetical protein
VVAAVASLPVSPEARDDVFSLFRAPPSIAIVPGVGFGLRVAVPFLLAYLFRRCGRGTGMAKRWSLLAVPVALIVGMIVGTAAATVAGRVSIHPGINLPTGIAAGPDGAL